MHSVGKLNLWSPGDAINDQIEHDYGFTFLEGVSRVADVTGVGGITALDAAYILQHTVDTIHHFPAEEGYYRLWDPPSIFVAAEPVAIASEPKLHKLVKLGDPVASGEQVVVPVTIDQMQGVLAGNLTLHYPGGGWQVAAVRKGDLTSGYMLTHNAQGEELRVAFAGSQAPDGSGTLFEVVFAKADAQQSDTGTLNLSEVQLNEGQIDTEVGAAMAAKTLDLPRAFALQAHYPNPFNPTTTIKYELPVGAAVELTVYDLVGQQVRTLQTGRQEAGRHQLEWDGRDDLGKEVASGMYMYKLVTPERTLVRKMMLLR